MSARTRRLVRSVHKWLGLLLALQMLGWLSSGLVMSVIPIEMVRGSTWVKQPEESAAARIGDFRIAPAALADTAGFSSAIAAIRLGEPVYLLREGPRTVRVAHALDGREIPPLDAAAAAALAGALHSEHPPVRATELVADPAGEARGLHGPVWRVQLADRWNTRVYIDPQTARLLSVRNDIWRFYDFFWMLHILDFEERSDFNNGLLRGSAALAWFIGLSGVWLLFYSFGRGTRGTAGERARGG